MPDVQMLSSEMPNSVTSAHQHFLSCTQREELKFQAELQRKKIGEEADMFLKAAILEYQSGSPAAIRAIARLHS